MEKLDILLDKKNRTKLQRQFRKNGFIFHPGFLSLEEISKVRHTIDEFIHGKGLQKMKDREIFYEDISDKSTLKQLQQLQTYDPFFNQMMFGSRFEQLASLLLQDKVIGKNMQYFNKPPKIGKPTPPHQDGYYFMLEPNEAVTMWMPLEPVDEQNGCVRYVKGSHVKGMRPHGRTTTLGFSQGILDFGKKQDLENEVYFKTNPGDLLVHHSLTIHWAEGNQSEDRSRKALGFIYYAESAQENRQAHEEYAKNLAKEMKEAGLI